MSNDTKSSDDTSQSALFLLSKKLKNAISTQDEINVRVEGIICGLKGNPEEKPPEAREDPSGLIPRLETDMAVLIETQKLTCSLIDRLNANVANLE